MNTVAHIDRMEKYHHDAMGLLEDFEQAVTREDYQNILERIPVLLEEDETISELLGNMGNNEYEQLQPLIDQLGSLYQELQEVKQQAKRQLDTFFSLAAPAAGGKRKSRKGKSRKGKGRKGKGRKGTRRV